VHHFIDLGDRRAVAWLWIAAGLCGIVVLASLLLPRADGQLIGSDGKFYYSILRSAVFDRDFDFANDYQLLQVDTIDSIGLTPIGKRTNPFALGTSLLWLPFLLVGHLIALAVNHLGCSVALDGSSNLHQAMVCLGTVFYAGGGFVLSYRLARKWFPAFAAFLAVISLWFASPAVYYMVGQPSMSHAVSIGSNALFLFIWLSQDHPGSMRRTLLLGLTVGLLALVRWQDAILLVLPLSEFVHRAAIHELPWHKAFIHSALLLAVALAIFTPQMLMWNSVYGAALTMPQGSSFMQWSSPRFFSVLFSTRHGLFSWHPVVFIAVLGIAPLAKRNQRLAMLVAVMFLLQLYINSAVERWWADESFGGRRFTGLMPALALPLSALIEWLWRRGRQRILITALLFLIFWNGLSFAQYRLGWVSRRDALSWREMTIDRLCLPGKILQERRLTPN